MASAMNGITDIEAELGPEYLADFKIQLAIFKTAPAFRSRIGWPQSWPPSTSVLHMVFGVDLAHERGSFSQFIP